MVGHDGLRRTGGIEGTTDKASQGRTTGQDARAPPKASARPATPLNEPAKPVNPVLQAIVKLQKRFPQTFPKSPAPKVPLKIGIFEDLVQHAQELGLTESVLRAGRRDRCLGGAANCHRRMQRTLSRK
ncbi:ProQ/FINO family protein [Cupriavidus sp. CuC1]|uniref:ProQ/FINO family protein n=1 Tax=Cupriavidus sp. CuC1 TaxID=3373131 RepID=UPI0037D35C18